MKNIYGYEEKIGIFIRKFVFLETFETHFDLVPSKISAKKFFTPTYKTKKLCYQGPTLLNSLVCDGLHASSFPLPRGTAPRPRTLLD